MGNDKKYRYPGINFFTKDDQDIFCGRADDVQKLFDQVMLNNTVVLHGESGSGKSSLVQAGLIPLLEEQNKYLLTQHKPQYLPITVRLDSINKKSTEDDIRKSVDGEILVSQIMNGINEFKDLKATGLPYISVREDSFWYTAKLFERNNYTLLLILDQFEEMQGYSNKDALAFTKKLFELFVSPMPEAIYEEYDHKTAELFTIKEMPDEAKKELNKNIKFLEQRLNVRLLFVVREDKLGTMSLLSGYFPNILKNDFFLLPLNEKGAKSAILEPARKEGDFKYESFSFDEPAIASLLQNLVDANGLYDPIQLQIVCSNIERKVSVNKRLIKKEDVPAVGDIIRDFYVESWKSIKEKFSLSEAAYAIKRKAIIEKLVVGNSRNLVLEKLLVIDSNAQDENIIKSLVAEGLLRKIPTGQDTFYQLSHDRLMQPLNDDLLELKVKEAATEEKRIQKQKQDEQQQKLEMQRKRLIVFYSLSAVLLLSLGIAVYFYKQAEKATNEANQNLTNLTIEQAKMDSTEFTLLESRANTIWDAEGDPTLIVDLMDSIRTRSLIRKNYEKDKADQVGIEKDSISIKIQNWKDSIKSGIGKIQKKNDK